MTNHNVQETVETDLNDDDEVDQSEQMFHFVEVPSFEPLYFMKVLEKGTENLSDPYNHFIGTGERYFKGCYLKRASSKNISFKQFQILPTAIVVNPDEIDDTYVSINESLQLDIDAYNYLIQKASS